MPQSFEFGRLTVEFIEADQVHNGRYPSYVGSAVFDRLQVIRDATEWDRCLVMDYDQIALCDLAPLFETDFQGNLLAARMHGNGIDLGYAMRHYRKNEPMPQGWEHTAGYPYFCMGPLLNLTEMRRDGTWAKVLAAHEAFNAEEQMALTAATGGRTVNYDTKWNLFPDADCRADEIPDGMVHWTGYSKPWHPGTRVWRPDIWEAEETSWEALRNGWWEKPRAVEVEPQGFRGVNHLARRGWRVQVLHPREAPPVEEKNPREPGGFPEVIIHAEDGGGDFSGNAGAGAESRVPRIAAEDQRVPFPDVEVVEHPAAAQTETNTDPRAKKSRQSLKTPPQAWAFEKADMVRFGPGVEAEPWLAESAALPQYIVLEGPVPAETAARLRARGYRRSCLIRREDWPGGGPAPSVLDDWTEKPVMAAAADGEDLYLQRDPSVRQMR